jgi:hypothetical protein
MIEHHPPDVRGKGVEVLDLFDLTHQMIFDGFG